MANPVPIAGETVCLIISNTTGREKLVNYIKKNPPLFSLGAPLKLSAQAYPYSPDSTVAYQWQDKLFTHQLGFSSSLPRALWRLLCNHLHVLCTKAVSGARL